MSLSVEQAPHPNPYCPAPCQLVLEIYVSSLEHSIQFYTSLGFVLEWHVPGVFAQVSWDTCLLFLKVKQTSEAVHASPGNIRVMVPDVDAQYRKCTEKLKCEVIQELGDRKFVLRDFVVRDPDGFGVRFGSFLVGRGRSEQQGPDDEIVIKANPNVC